MKNKLLRLVLMLSKFTFYGIVAQCLFISILIANDGAAQQNVSITEVNLADFNKAATIIELFDEIENQSNFKFFYDKRFIDKKKQIRIKKKKVTVADVLFEISKNSDLKFKQINSTINVSLKEGNEKEGILEIVQQARTVTGVVKSGEDGSTLPGVNVVIKGTSRGTVTDIDGNYKIDVQSEEAVLQFSSVGFISEEIAVGDKSVINLDMMPDVQALDEIVVVGYGSMRRADLTTAQTSISSDDIEKTVNTTLEQAIQGRSAGVFITQNTGAPGGGISVNIRGINSIDGSNQPLYVIDGIQIQGSTSATGDNPLSSLNPSDIASIEVLQGPSATAIYGSRGTNGVIMITTKQGKAGDIKISYGFDYSIQTTPEPLDVLTLPEYAQMENEYKEIVGGDVREDFLDPSILGPGTDWQDELFNSAAMQKHQLSVSGGSENTTFYLSGERMNQEGVAVGSGFERTSFRLNVNTKPKDWFNIGANVNYSETEEQLGANNLNGSNLIVNAIQLAPQIPVRNPDGSFGGGNPDNNAEQFSPPNPIGLASLSTNEQTRRRILGNLTAGVTPIDGLEISTSFNTDIGFSNTTFFLPTYDWGWQENNNARLSDTDNLNTYWAWNQTVRYTREFNQHNIVAMVTHESQESTWKNLSASRDGFLTNEVLDLNAGDAATAGNGGGQGEWAMESYLGRINYNFDDRYLITAAFRADGSANFGPGNKWGYFPSASAAWRVSEESFFNVPFFTDLRVRYETGLTGSQGSGGAIYGSFASAVPTEWGSGFRPGRYPNPNFQWEETLTNNLGLTIGMFDNRVQIDADIYRKETDNLILTAEFPWYMGTEGTGAPAAPIINAGSLENKGIGISLRTVNINNQTFKWESDFNISAFRTKITALTTGSTHITREAPDWFLANFAQRSEIGSAPWMFYGYIEEGIFQTREEVENSARPVDNNGELLPVEEDGIWVGDVKYKDVSGPEGVPDGKITADDRTFIGNPWPLTYGGFTNTFSYKGFDVSILLSYSYGNDVYNYLRYQNGNPNNINLGRNMFEETFDYAKVELDEEGEPYLLNPGTDINRFSSSSLNGNYDRLTDKYLEDGSYLRIKNITVNYRVPASIIERLKVVRSLMVGVSAQNVYTLTGYSGYDPEVGSYVGPNSAQAGGFVGVDYGRYPLTPMYSVNVKVEF